jgi:glutathione S-transferase
MIIVHHLNDSRSQRILWLLEELNLPYEIRQYQRDPVTRVAPPELKAVHALGKSPVITDDGRVVAESGAIIEYILRHHGGGRLHPDASSAAYDEYLQWLHYAEASAMPALIVRGVVARLGDAAKSFLPRLDADVGSHLAYMDRRLEGRRYLLGDDLTGADIQVSFVGEFASARVGISGYPNIAAWVKRFQARPAYRTALARGGTYSFAS